MLNLEDKIKEIDDLIIKNKKELEDMSLSYTILLQSNHELQLEKECYISELEAEESR